MVADGATVLLTTQYMEEAEQLADELTVFDRGRVIAERPGGGAEGPGRRPHAADPAGRSGRAAADGRGVGPQPAGRGRRRDRGPGGGRGQRADHQRRATDRRGRPCWARAVSASPGSAPICPASTRCSSRSPGRRRPPRRSRPTRTAPTATTSRGPRHERDDDHRAGAGGTGQGRGPDRPAGQPAAHRRARPAQRAPDQAGPGVDVRRPADADHLHAAVRVRLRRRDLRPGQPARRTSTTWCPA